MDPHAVTTTTPAALVRPPHLAYLSLLLLVPLLALVVFALRAPQIEREVYADLEVVARLKADQIESWLLERQRDALTLSERLGLSSDAAMLAQGQFALQERVRERLESIRRAYDYDAMLLVDARGQPLLPLGVERAPPASTLALIPLALLSSEMQRSELVLDEDGRPHLDFVVPLRRPAGYGRTAVVLVILHVHPERSLFRLIQRWPTASPSAETLLVRRDGDSVVILNELRHLGGSALQLRFPFDRQELPAAIAVRETQPGTVQGRDYRDVPVFAAYQAVAGSDWHIVTKVDRAEALLPLWDLLTWVSLVALAGVLAIIAVLYFLWQRQQQLSSLQARLRRDELQHEGEMRYRAVTESSSDAIVMADAGGDIVSWNPAAERLFGHVAGEAIGQPLTLLMPPRFRDAHCQGIRRVLAGEAARLLGRRVELAGLHKSGSEFPLELSLAQWNSGGERFFIGTLRDITERKGSEAKLQRLTRIYAALSEHDQSMALYFDENALFEQICRDAVHFGGARMAWVGLLDADTQRVRPACSFGEGGEAYLRDLQVSADAGTPFGRGPIGIAVRENRPLWLRDFLGDARTEPWHEAASAFGWASLAVLPLRRTGAVIGVFCLYAGDVDAFDEGSRDLLVEMAMDISFALDNFDAQVRRMIAETHTRQLLAENETILNNALVGIVHLKEGLVVACNRRFEEIFHFATGALLGRSSEIFFESPAVCTAVGLRADAALREGKSYSEEVMFRRQDGSLFWGALNGRAIDPASPQEGSIWIYADISERVRLEAQLHDHQVHLEVLVQKRTAELEEALAAARQADQAKDAFLANVSHELRTPLNAVIGMSDLARRLSRDAQQQAYLDKVGSAGKTLSLLINDLLDLSKIVAGRLEFEAVTFSLRQLVQRSNSVMAYKAAESGLQLIEDIGENVPDILVGDPLRIEQILLNLLSNAIKFTPAGSVTLRIGLQSRAAQGVCLAVDVEDTGVGLRAEEIASIFKPFAQADASMTRKYGGSGLGLAICKRLAEMMGGDISVSSRFGQGSTFHVTLWLVAGEAADLPVAQESVAQALPVRYEKTHVLVVEDQPMNREIVEALLGLVGITAEMAGNGQEALDILAEKGPAAFDLVLMDIQMPVMDGLSAARALRTEARFATLPIIAMTAHTMEHERDASRRAGMNDHIGKPFDNESFYRTLARWIASEKQLHQAADSASPAAHEAVSLGTLQGLDSAAGIARLGGNEARYRHWLEVFVEEGPATVLKIRQSLADGDEATARQVAHACKGRVGMLGMDDVFVVVSALESLLKQGEPAGQALDRLQAVVERTVRDIVVVLGRPAGQGALPQPLATLSQAQSGVLVRLVALLDAADGASAAAIACCLEQAGDDDLARRLRQALAHAQNFDFAAAKAVLLSPSGIR